MKSVNLLITLFWFLLSVNNQAMVSSSNILFYMPFGSVSHIYSMAPLANSLINRGHSVTLLSMHVPKSVLHVNMTTVPLDSVLKVIEADRPNYFGLRKFSIEANKKMIRVVAVDGCHALLKDPGFLKIARDKKITYDLIVMDTLMSECGLSLVAQLGSPPLIYYCTTAPYLWTAWSFNIPSPFSYIPSQLLALTDHMGFLERGMNLLAQSLILVFRQLYLLSTAQEIVDEYYPNLPRLTEIENNVSIVLSNSYSGTLDYARPLAPFVIEVGGTHCRKPNPLPKDLDEFVSGAGEHGFIFFSLGSNIAGTDLDEPRRAALLKAFGRLEQRVLWKFEENITNLPANVRIQNWAPQQDLLGHPKIKAFFTHGGQLSIQEAVYHGVPMLGLPVMGDQLSNIKNVVAKGMADEIDYDELQEEIIYNRLSAIVTNTRYKVNSKKYSTWIRDRPMDALESSVYWVEYVIRHNGTRHLRLNAAGNLNFFQYFLLDIVAMIILICIAILSMISYIFLKIFTKTVKAKQKVQ